MKLSFSFLQKIRPAGKLRIGNLALYLLSGFVMLLIGFILFFPEAALLQRLQYEINRNVPATVTMESATLTFPLSIRADNIRIRMNDRTIPELTFDTLKVTPLLSTFIGKPGISFNATAGNGRIDGSFSRSGELALDIENYAFDEPIGGFSELKVSGNITTGHLQSHLQPDPDKPSAGHLAAGNLKLTGTKSLGLAVDAIALGNLDLDISGRGRNLEVNRAVMTGGDLSASASGRIILGRTVPATRLNLQVQLKPETGLPPEVRSLFDLVGSAGEQGARKLTISGTLGRPNMK